jgi:arsenite methyltransferase
MINSNLFEIFSNINLISTACCTGKDIPRHIKQALSKIHEEILSSYYGCGLVAPAVLEGTRVLDLGKPITT